MKLLKRESLKLLKNVTKTVVKQKSEEWPPGCFGLTYQPKRPEKR
ncbi:MAG: AgrD family cyclic lactone autoinducer peptide [Lachnospira sp.]